MKSIFTAILVLLVCASVSLAGSPVQKADRAEVKAEKKELKDFRYNTIRGVREDLREVKDGKKQRCPRVHGAVRKVKGAAKAAKTTACDAAEHVKDSIVAQHKRNCEFLKGLRDKAKAKLCGKKDRSPVQKKTK